MNRDVLRALRPGRCETASGRPGGKRIATICLVALFATGIWWVILHFGSRAVGYPIGSAWLLPVLTGIFLLLVLGWAWPRWRRAAPPMPKRHGK